jgi:hypothetical protein
MTNHKLCQFIVKKYIQNNVNWAREIKIAQKLTKKYKDYSFWNNLRQVKLPSLAWFLTEEGLAFINIGSKVQEMKEQPKEKHLISNNKIGEDKKTCQKPKNIIQFIRSWEENQKKK